MGFDKFDDFKKTIVKNDDKRCVFNFWVTLCTPSLKELPHFEKLHQENKNVTVILVSIDSKKDIEKN